MKLFCNLSFDNLNYSTDSILDTAAEANLISRRLANHLNLPILPANTSLVGLGDARSAIAGTLTAVVNGMELEFFVVEHISSGVELLIGWPSLDNYGVTISSLKGSTYVSLNGTILTPSSVHYNSHYPTQLSIEKSTDVRTTRRVVLAPFSQRYIHINWNTTFAQDEKASYVLTPARVLANTPLKVLSGIVDKNTKRILLSNWGPTEVVIAPGALIGYVTLNSFSVLSISLDDDEMYLPSYSTPPSTSPTVSSSSGGSDDGAFPQLRRPTDKVHSTSSHSQHLSPLPTFSPPSTNHATYNDAELVRTIEEGGLISDERTVEEKAKLLRMLKDNKSVFAKNPNGPGVTTKTKMHVKLKDSNPQPIRSHPYRVPVHLQSVIKGMIDNMMRDGIIRKSSSPWASPVVLATKPDGSYRFCVDYTKLNAMSVRESFPLPNLEEHLDRLASAKVFSVMDLASGFWQIQVAEEDIEKLAFVTPLGTYEFLRMPFGYQGAPSIFQAAITETLDPILYAYALVYIDDIIIYSNDFPSHLQHLSSCFSLLKHHNWNVKLSKCRFASSTVNYLGHIVSQGKISPLDKNIDKLMSMKQPETAADILSLLSTVGFYKKFILGYDYLVQPLRELERKYKDTKTKFVLSDFSAAHSSYLSLLKLISSKPILSLYDPSLPVVVKTDCSKFAWGAALCQERDGIELPVCFASGTLNSTQRNWPTWKREGYACLRAIEKWRHYLIGNHFTLVTDHSANTYILDPSRSHPPIINNWIILLSQYSYTVRHRPGKTLFIEDALSRSPSLLLFSLSSINENVARDPLYSSIISSISSNTNLLTEEQKKSLGVYADVLNRFVIEDGSLFLVENSRPARRFLRLVVTDADLVLLFSKHHCSPLAGHLGWARTLEAISREYWCPDLFKKLKNLYDRCTVCENHRVIRNETSEKHLFTSSPFEILELDHIIVDTPSQGYNYILCVTDVFSRKSWFLPTKTLEAREAYSLLFTHVFSPFHFPKFLYSDLGSAFDNELDELICTATGIKHRYTLPRSKGHTAAVENRNKVAEQIISKFLSKFNQDNWADFLFSASYAYNKSINPSTNFSPDFLVFGTDPFSVVELERVSESNITRDEYSKKFVADLSKSWNLAKNITRKILLKKNSENSIDSEKKFYINEWVWLSRKAFPNSHIKGHFLKFEKR